MFGHITGEIFDIKPTRVIVKTSGIGFNINTTPSFTQNLRVGAQSAFWTHTAVRENSIEIYGFETEEELKIFELLMTVSGVGPKSALTILSVAGIRAIEAAVSTGDTSHLTTISGVGKKTADKIVLELSGKIVRNEKDFKDSNGDVFEALKSLGYKEKQIQDVLRGMPEKIEGMNEKIKYALVNLGK